MARHALGDKLYFEDVQVGLAFETPALTLTETHVALFNGLVEHRSSDPRAVPDLLPLCLSAGLGWRARNAHDRRNGRARDRPQ